MCVCMCVCTTKATPSKREGVYVHTTKAALNKGVGVCVCVQQWQVNIIQSMCTPQRQLLVSVASCNPSLTTFPQAIS